jgi:hypothetical protein
MSALPGETKTADYKSAARWNEGLRQRSGVHGQTGWIKATGRIHGDHPNNATHRRFALQLNPAKDLVVLLHNEPPDSWPLANNWLRNSRR